MEDYKKKYEDANKRVAIRFGSDVARELFPDLYESEDEKISQEIIDFISQYSEGTFNFGIKDYTFKKWIDWIKKQNKQNIPLKEIILNVWELGNIWKANTKGLCNIEGTELDYILKHWTDGEHYNKMLKRQGEQKETICDKCRKEQPSHSCQDITELGRCALEATKNMNNKEK